MAFLAIRGRILPARSAILLLGTLGGPLLAAACMEPFYAQATGGSATAGTASTSSASGGSTSAPVTSAVTSTSGSSGTPAPCETDAPGACGATAYCLVGSACSGKGTCVPLPGDSGSYDPVCGCDGLTYWNPAQAVSAKASIRATGACGAEGQTCVEGADTCRTKFGEGVYCNIPVSGGGACPSITNPPVPPPSGTCWVMPATCADATTPTGYACLSPGKCKTACALIGGELPWWEAGCTPEP